LGKRAATLQVEDGRRVTAVQDEGTEKGGRTVVTTVATPSACHAISISSKPLVVLYSAPDSTYAKERAMGTTTTHAGENEVTILARILGNERGQLPHEMAPYILDLGFSDQDKAQVHDLAERNQDDALSPAEKEELFAFGKAGNLLSILKSKARRTLGIKPKKRTTS